jgi:hypothetical protein
MEVYSCTDSTKSSVAAPEPDPQGSETFGRIRIRSGTKINISDPDSPFFMFEGEAGYKF